MARPKYRSIDAPFGKDEEPDWHTMTKSDAVRQASQLLSERSPTKVVRFLEERGIKVAVPQAVKVLGVLYGKREPAANLENVISSVQTVVAVQKYASEHGGIKSLAEKISEAKALVEFANSLGGFGVLEAIAKELSISA